MFSTLLELCVTMEAMCLGAGGWVSVESNIWIPGGRSEWWGEESKERELGLRRSA